MPLQEREVTQTNQLSQSGGNRNWGINTPDTRYATAFSNTTNVNMATIKTLNYGFSIPSDATITSIDVRVSTRGFSNNTSNGVQQAFRYQVSMPGGTETRSTTAPKDGIYWVTQFTNTLWGRSWTPADINDPNFGVYITHLESVRAAQWDVKLFKITVSYELPASKLKVCLGNTFVSKTLKVFLPSMSTPGEWVKKPLKRYNSSTGNWDTMGD